MADVLEKYSLKELLQDFRSKIGEKLKTSHNYP